ncbi:zinc-binding dehydrogenase [Curtobacterium flaccumfaciens]|uniref:zinc-binding dehydrogenase n=1 Tax=Curtobacterium flaccumfaciens TaxID=2035 RepID=UPI00188BDFEB|nr:zinc-binding dehydrogenase [Curtobacterium flaccumfaciens]
MPRDGDVVAAVRQRYPSGVNAVIDLVSFGTTGVYDGALRDGGRVVSATNAAGEGEGRTNVNHMPGKAMLSRVAEHLSDGTIVIHISETGSLDHLPDALTSFRSHHHHGKVTLSHDEPAAAAEGPEHPRLERRTNDRRALHEPCPGGSRSTLCSRARDGQRCGSPAEPKAYPRRHAVGTQNHPITTQQHRSRRIRNTSNAPRVSPETDSEPARGS